MQGYPEEQEKNTSNLTFALHVFHGLAKKDGVQVVLTIFLNSYINKTIKTTRSIWHYFWVVFGIYLLPGSKYDVVLKI